MGFIGWIVLGLLAGIIAKVLMPGRDPGGCIITMLIGVAGALLGGFLSSRLLNIDRGGFFDLRTWIIAIVGSIILLLIYRLIAGAQNAAVTAAHGGPFCLEGAGVVTVGLAGNGVGHGDFALGVHEFTG